MNKKNAIQDDTLEMVTGGKTVIFDRRDPDKSNNHHSGATSSNPIDDSNITEIIVFKHKHPLCNITFATFTKPTNCPACNRPDSPEYPIEAL